MKYLGNPSLLEKDLLKSNQVKNKKIVNQSIHLINKLRNAVIRKEPPENENANKIIDIVEKFLDFHNQQNGKRLETITRKQMLQRLPIAPAQVKAGSTSESLLMKSYKSYILFIKQKRLLKKYIAYNEFNKGIIQIGYHIYEFWKQQNI